jgi:hypothetical protein
MQPDKMEERMEKYLGRSSNDPICDPTRASGARVLHEFGVERENAIERWLEWRTK